MGMGTIDRTGATIEMVKSSNGLVIYRMKTSNGYSRHVQATANMHLKRRPFYNVLCSRASAMLTQISLKFPFCPRMTLGSNLNSLSIQTT